MHFIDPSFFPDNFAIKDVVYHSFNELLRRYIKCHYAKVPLIVDTCFSSNLRTFCNQSHAPLPRRYKKLPMENDAKDRWLSSEIRSELFAEDRISFCIRVLLRIGSKKKPMVEPWVLGHEEKFLAKIIDDFTHCLPSKNINL